MEKENKIEKFDICRFREYEVKSYRLDKDFDIVLEDFIKPLILEKLEILKNLKIYENNKKSWLSMNGTRITEYNKEQLVDLYKQSDLLILEYPLFLNNKTAIINFKNFNGSFSGTTYFIKDEICNKFNIEYNNILEFKEENKEQGTRIYDRHKIYYLENEKVFKISHKNLVKEVTLENLDTIINDECFKKNFGIREIYIHNTFNERLKRTTVKVLINNKLVLYLNEEDKVKYQDDIANIIKKELKEKKEIELKRIYKYPNDTKITQDIEKIKIGDYIVKDNFNDYKVFSKEIFEELYELTNF